jgi:cytochrome c oxidase subunit IV
MSRAAKVVLRVWLALFALLALTTAIAFLPLGSFNLAIALGIAIAKALLVLWFFMELRVGSGLTRAFAAAAFFWLLILIVLTWADYSHRADVHVPLDPNPTSSR